MSLGVNTVKVGDIGQNGADVLLGVLVSDGHAVDVGIEAQVDENRLGRVYCLPDIREKAELPLIPRKNEFLRR